MSIMPFSPAILYSSLLHFFFCCFSVSALAPTNKMPAAMTRGVGLYCKLVAKSAASVPPLLRTIQDHFKTLAGPLPKRATVVSVGREVALVEEYESKEEYEQAAQSDALASILRDQGELVQSSTTEYFPEALHISNPIEPTTETIGILVRQKTHSTENGAKLRDAQREAYERQMTKEPGCTCCIILAGSEKDATQVRIIELWKTMDDFYVHETSEWHTKGEEKVVPLVIDMDCDFVEGWQLLQDH